MNEEQQPIISNCQVSQPILYPGLQIKGFNGFAWSNTLGMIHQVDSSLQSPYDTWIPN